MSPSVFRAASASLFLAITLVSPASGQSEGSESSPSRVPATEKPVPTSIDDFREIATVTRALAEQATEATVGVQLGDAYASGVVVSADGYVLTASHVSGSPGRKVRITFDNGRIVSGRTLGQNPDVDGALVKIDVPGPFPFLPMAEQGTSPQPGEWCIATGHPGGYESGRPPPIRLGRVIFANGYTVRSDCPIQPGDSGGPLIDLRGYVIGIHSRIFDDATGNLHVPMVTYWRTWDALKSGKISQIGPSSSFLAQFDFDVDGTLTLTELPAGLRREVFHRMAEEFDFDPTEPQEIKALRQTIGLNLSKRPNSRLGSAAELLFQSPGSSDMLSEHRYTRGIATLNVLRQITEAASDVTVEIEVNEMEAAHGTIVDPDGWVASKASEIELIDAPERIACLLADSRRAKARLVHVDRENDLAWLKIDLPHLPTIPWASGNRPPVGSWVVSASRGRTPMSAGVVSVAPRFIKSTPGFLGIGGSHARNDAYVATIFENSGASNSELRVGDVILSVDDTRISSFRSLAQAVRRRKGGDILRLGVRRDDSDEVVVVRLGHRIDPLYRDEPDMSGRLSDRRDGFPFAMLHDSVLDPEQCGGPLINLDGEVIGINIARQQRTGSLALTHDTIVRSLEAAKRREESRP